MVDRRNDHIIEKDLCMLTNIYLSIECIRLRKTQPKPKTSTFKPIDVFLFQSKLDFLHNSILQRRKMNISIFVVFLKSELQSIEYTHRIFAISTSKQKFRCRRKCIVLHSFDKSDLFSYMRS